MRREAEVEVGEMGTTEGFLESREEGRHLEQETDATVLGSWQPDATEGVCFGVLFFLEDGCSGVGWWDPLSVGQLCLCFFSFDLSSCSGICKDQKIKQEGPYCVVHAKLLLL